MSNNNEITTVGLDSLANKELGEFLNSEKEKNAAITEFFRKMNDALDDGFLEDILTELSRHKGGYYE